MKTTILNLLIVLLAISGAIAQSAYKISNQNFVVAGTSNIHDWTMISKEATATAVIDMKDGKIKEIVSLKITIPAESLKSSKSGMDKVAYKAMKTNKYSTIVFTLKNVKRLTVKGNETEITATGKLNLSGVEKDYTMTVKGKVLNNQIIFEGSVPIKMTDHKIDPPTAMLGAVKSGDDTTVTFKVEFAQTTSAVPVSVK